MTDEELKEKVRQLLQDYAKREALWRQRNFAQDKQSLSIIEDTLIKLVSDHAGEQAKRKYWIDAKEG